MTMEGNNKKDFWKNAINFLEKNGFYVALGICIVIIAVAVLSVRNNETNEGDDLVLDGFEQDDDTVYGNVIDEYFVMYDQLPVEPADSYLLVIDNSDIDDQEAIPVNAGVEPGGNQVVSSLEFIMPVTGSITFDYSMDKLTYSRTLEEWRTHSGVDLAAEIGTAVACVADGVITDIKNDPGFGLTIIVEHDNNLKTVYSNLSSADMVQVNQKVKSGDVIGAVGDTALFECAEQSHLHFEVWENNKIVDPKMYLPVE